MSKEAAMIYLRKGKELSAEERAQEQQILFHHESAGSKHHPNDCQRKRSLGQLAKWGAITLLIGALAALTVWYVGYLMYEALQ